MPFEYCDNCKQVLAILGLCSSCGYGKVRSMDKKEILERMNTLYSELEGIIDDESIKGFGRAIQKHLDDFGSFCQDIEDEISEENQKKEENEND